MARTVTGTLTVNSVSVNYLLCMPRGCSNLTGGASGRRAIIVGHGHGGTSGFIAQGGTSSGYFGNHAMVLADAGYVVGCIDNNTEFMDNDAMDRQNALRTHLVTDLGCKTKVGWSGMSMGGGTALTYLLLNPTLVSCIYAFAPGWDLRFIGSAAGYTIPYSTTGLVSSPDPTWATELTSDYPSGYASHDPGQNISSYANTVPIKIAHATDDPTLSYAGSQYFVTQVNASNVTFRTPDVTGGHSSTFINNIPTSEVLNFFNSQWVD